MTRGGDPRCGPSIATFSIATSSIASELAMGGTRRGNESFRHNREASYVHL